MANIANIVGATGVQLEAQAFNALGAAVSNQANGILSSIFGTGAAGGALPSSVNISAQLAQDLNALSQPSVWDPTPYASLFASGAGGFDPKTKFLFKVTFTFIPGVAQELSQILGIASPAQFAASQTFTIKSIDLPKYRFEYEEVNYYNFRTQILKRINHDELAFMMYDTTGNQALNLMNAYLQLLMPLSRQPYTTNYALWDHGFAFTQDPSQGADSGSRANLGTNGTEINIFDTMIIDQYYLSRDPGAGLRGPNIVSAIKVNSFTFTNPKLTRFELGDQDHEKGAEAPMITCSFNYDALYMQTNQLGMNVAPTRPALNDDLLSNVVPNGANIIRGPQVGYGGGALNPFLAAFAAQAGRTVGVAAGQILAAGGLGNSPGGGLAISSVSGALGTNAARTIATIGSTPPGISLPTQPVLTDNSQTTAQTTVLSSQNPASTASNIFG